MVKDIEPSFEELLEKIKDENEEVRIESIYSLGKLGDKRAIIPLYELFFRKQKSDYESEVENKQDSAISWVLWDASEPLLREDTAEYLVKGLESRIEGVRISISSHLADQGWEWGEDWIIKPLLKKLIDSNEEVRDNCLEAPVARENKKGGRKFLELMESIEKENEERKREVKLWRNRKIKRSIMNIRSLIETEPPTSIREIMFGEMMKMKEYSSENVSIDLDYFIKLLDHPESSTRELAVLLLEELGDERIIETLVKYSKKEKNQEIKQLIEEAMGKILERIKQIIN